MMMKNIITLLVFGLILFSCSRNEDEIPEENMVTQMYVKTFFLNTLSPNTIDSKFVFDYDVHKNLIKKTGGFLQSSGSTGLGGYFTNTFYTTLVYDNNKVTVEDFLSDPIYTVPKNSRYYTLNNQSQIIQKETPYIYGPSRDEKQVFKYTNNQLTEIFTTLPNMPYDPTEPDDYIETHLEKFYYDSNGNLTKTEFYVQHNSVNTNQKTIRTFEDYDNSVNPCKKIYLLDDFFYRSLSKNNYRKYTEIEYNILGEIISNSVNTWTFNYDSNGNIIIN